MDGREKLRIVHCFRAPVGGVFRHVRDLARKQAEDGHEVGLICDSTTGGEFEDRQIEALRPSLELGVIRIPMRRAVTPGDLVTLVRTYSRIRRMRPDVLHAHGAKGGAYARLIGTALRMSGRPVIRLYSPHGGSIHYDAASLKGRVYFTFERLLERMTDRLIFVSDYERRGYEAKVGKPRCPVSLVHNGLSREEFEPVEPAPDAADFLFIGTLRVLKGPDIFIEALAIANGNSDRPVTARLVGDGEDEQACREQIEALELGGNITMHPPMPAREAFAMARNVVVPSRAESLPYIVLEAIAAGRPIIATRVGGIPEILSDQQDRLVPPEDAHALAQSMLATVRDPEPAEITTKRRERIAARFSVEVMACEVERAYRAAV